MIHHAILVHVKDTLQTGLIDSITDDTQAGAVKIGPLNGDPMDPDSARISLEVYPNDPDQEIKGSGIATSDQSWKDEVLETEIGGGITWARRFTVKCRCLFENSHEDLDNALRIAYTVRSRMEKLLLEMTFSNLNSAGEYVCRGVFGDELTGEITHSGGPPDAYDFFIKVRFEVWTSRTL